MAERLPIVCVLGTEGISLFSSPRCPEFETNALDTRCYANDEDLAHILVVDRPDVIVTVGDAASFPRLGRAAASVRQRWIHFKDASDLARMGKAAFFCFVDNCVRERTDLEPLVSVFTCTYKTGPLIERPYTSLRAQTYTNWEWILVDDSDDDGVTFRMLSQMARENHRLGVFKPHRHSGALGEVKRWACRLANGRILVELDHDDELVPDTLKDLVRAFRYFDGSSAERPEAGFVSGDFAETYPDGSPVMYGEGWAFGFGRYRFETHAGRRLAVAHTPLLNAKTVRHIVGVPNHVRAWSSDAYHALGGHRRQIHVADDYELLVRTFLGTRMAHIPKLSYIQWRNHAVAIDKGNTHQARNREIQRLTRAFSQTYDRRIHERLLELGVDDYVWKDGEDTFHRMGGVPNPDPVPHATLIWDETVLSQRTPVAGASADA